MHVIVSPLSPEAFKHQHPVEGCLCRKGRPEGVCGWPAGVSRTTGGKGGGQPTSPLALWTVVSESGPGALVSR